MSDLTDRMRTCAAFILRGEDHKHAQIYSDAADLLIEASNALEAIPPPLGEPMEIIEAKPLPPRGSDERKVAREEAIGRLTGAWIDPGGALPTVSELTPLKRHPRVCPTCDSRANKKVVRLDAKLMLVCPVCSATWEWKR